MLVNARDLRTGSAGVSAVDVCYAVLRGRLESAAVVEAVIPLIALPLDAVPFVRASRAAERVRSELP